MIPRIKICGITVPEEAAAIAAEGVDFIGLNFWRKSRRCVLVEPAVELAAAAREAGPPAVVGLFVGADLREIVEVVRRVDLDVVQLHGDETIGYIRELAASTGVPIWKAVPVAGPADVEDLDDLPVEAVVLDASTPARGGSGQTIDWSLAREAVQKSRSPKIVLAGGLTPENVRTAIARVGPWAVDVASGVEWAPGRKDLERVRAFLRAAGAPSAK